MLLFIHRHISLVSGCGFIRSPFDHQVHRWQSRRDNYSLKVSARWSRSTYVGVCVIWVAHRPFSLFLFLLLFRPISPSHTQRQIWYTPLTFIFTFFLSIHHPFIFLLLVHLALNWHSPHTIQIHEKKRKKKSRLHRMKNGKWEMQKMYLII